MKKNWFTKKKLLFSLTGATMIVAAPVILTACSSIDSDLVDKTISKGNGTLFANNYSISDMAKKALQSDSGQKAMASEVQSTMMLDWFERLSTKEGQQITKTTLEDQKETVDDDYTDAYKSSQSSNGANHPLKWQQDTLDLNGGTEASYKKKKMLEWAKTQFSTELFNKNYLAVKKADGSYTQTPTEDQIINAITNSNGYSFTFSADAINTNKNPYADNQYAKFQQFIFDQWVQIENPYVVNMSLWKYGTPTNGLNSIYNSAATSVTDTTSTGTYTFPYFATSTGSNNTGGATVKFTNFVNDAKNTDNFKANNESLKKLGIRDISTSYTDDTSTLILAKNGSIYDDLYIEFAAASSYLFSMAANSKSTNKAVSAISNIEKAITTTESNGLDAITSNFVSTAASTNPSAVKLSKDLVKLMINENGALKDLATQDLYTIDAFQPDSNSKLNEFMFIRDEAGVHAVAIDGQDYIKTANGDLSQAKKNAGQIVLYYYFKNKDSSAENAFKVDISSEIKTFYESNTDYLISKYIQENKDQELFVASSLDSNLINLYNNYATYAIELSRLDKVKSYNDKMFTQKQTYANNYGIDTKKNGFASGWIYNKVKVTDNTQLKDATVYDVATTVQYSTIDPYNTTTGSFKKYLDSIAPYINNLNLTTLESSYDGFKYSQYIYSNDYTVNAILLAYGADSNSMGDSIKVDILNDYLKDDFDLSTYKFKSGAFGGKTNTELDNALINSYYTSTFDSLSNKWTQYTDTSIVTTKLSNYKYQLYKNSMNGINSTNTTNQVSLLTLVATAKYLLANDGAELLNYLRDQITVGKDSYIAWYGQYDSTLTTDPASTSITTVKDMLDVNKSLKINLNNTYNSAYTGQKQTTTTKADATTDTLITVDKNNTNAIFSSNSKYYNVVDNKLGYMGLINSDSSIDSTEIKNMLFTDFSLNNPTKKGALYTYGSRTELVNMINNFTYESEVTDLADTISQKTNGAINTTEIFKYANDLEKKKTALTEAVNDTKIITDEMFNRRDNYIGVQPTTSTTADSTTTTNENVTPITSNTLNENIKYGAFVYQINSNDLKDWSSFNNIFNGSTSKNDIIYNLLFTAAADTNIQTNALTEILQTRKLDIYDVRLNTQLGPKWANNWKN